ncbi:hypothetical protein QCD60_10335 [Pokkaliibacter sp. MBI-7]|uniref:hypothetical protein n=1 Tax=Pokkaliibacter sp. MBI-7 TaxID=3040600 RepID=UPI00244C1472|nr:hypothetical protein [Pokkaliibacter sp. MBI-7]MDH2432964.1 hypothetical protein [Pokkaliibacter sp. MBI-7]
MSDVQQSCSKPAYIIEILGHDHPDSHKIVVENNGAPTRIEPVDGGKAWGKSTLHFWEKAVGAAAPPLKSWIEIKGSKGSFKIPLFDGAASDQDLFVIPKLKQTSRCGGRQQYVIAPFVPVEQIDSVFKTPVACRCGYLYIFRKGRLWRELEVSKDEQAGTPQFRDSNILAARGGSEQAPIGTVYQRQFISSWHKEIWLPVTASGQMLATFQLFFSDVQLTAERINYMETYPDQIAARAVRSRSGTPMYVSQFKAQPVHLGYDYQRLSKQPQYSTVPTGMLLWIDEMPEQRQRSPLQEWHYPQPDVFLTDLSGKAPQQEYHQAVDLVSNPSRQAYDKTVSTLAFKQALLVKEQPRMQQAQAKQTLEQGIKGQPAQAEVNYPQPDKDPVWWQAQGSEEDLYRELKPRSICVLMLDDAIGRLRHYTQQGQHAQDLLQTLLTLTGTHPFHRLAELVNHTILPKQVMATNAEGKKTSTTNPWHEENASYVDLSPGSPMFRMLYPSYRAAARQHLSTWQQKALALVSRKDTEAVLADLFSKNNSDYYAGFKLLGDALAMASPNPERLDTYQTPHAIWSGAYNQSAEALIIQILAYQHGLSRFLFPKPNVLDPTQPFNPKDYPAQPNPGDGNYRIDLMAGLSLFSAELRYRQPDKQMANPDDKTHEVTLLDMWAAASHNALKAVDNTLGPLIKRVANDVEAALGGLINVMQSLAPKAAPTALRVDAYGPLADLVRSSASTDLLRQLRWLPPNGKQPEKGVIVVGAVLGELSVGITAPSTKHSQHNGQWYLGDKLIGDTNKARYTKATGEPAGTTTRMGVYTYEAGSQAANDYAAFHRAMAVRLTRSNAAQAVHKLLSSVGFSAFMLGVEGWNLSYELRTFNTDRLDRSVTGSFSAIWDLGNATAKLLSLFDQRWQALQGINRTLETVAFDVSIKRMWMEKVADNALMKKLVTLLPNEITVAAAIGVVGNALTAAVFFMDALNEWHEGDRPAAFALLAAGVGASLLTVAAFASSMVWLGVIGLVLTVAGLAIYIAINRQPLQIYLQDGPLSKSPASQFAHLLNSPDEAWYRLINLLAAYRIEVSTSPYYDYVSAAQKASDFVAVRQMHPRIGECNVRVSVQSCLGRFVNQAIYLPRFQAISISGRRPRATLSVRPVQPTFTEITDLGENYYLTLGDTQWSDTPGPWQVLKSAEHPVFKCQIQVPDGKGGMWVFPAPLPNDSSTPVFHPAEQATPPYRWTQIAPDFQAKDQPYWLDDARAIHPKRKPSTPATPPSHAEGDYTPSAADWQRIFVNGGWW